MRIDHHIFCESIADIEWVDTSYESCCGQVTEFAVQSGLRLSPVSAKALYTGMITDSGRFRYDSTNANTFRLASKLMEQKIDTNDIYSKLYADAQHPDEQVEVDLAGLVIAEGETPSYVQDAEQGQVLELMEVQGIGEEN